MAWFVTALHRRLTRLSFALLIATGLVAPACFASDAEGTFTVFGVGANSCGKYLSEKDDQFVGDAYGTWLSGYFTAFDEQTNGIKDILKHTDIQGAMGWINNYCQRNPTDDFGKAAYKATEYLRSKMDSDISPPPVPKANPFLDLAPEEQSGPPVTFQNMPPPGPLNTVGAASLKAATGPKPASDPPLTLHGAKPEDAATAEIVTVKYRGPLSLEPFKCEAVTRSSFVQRVCYDAPNSYMLINLNGTWYHYCEIGPGTVSSLMAAESMGRFYNAAIKTNFDCRTHRVPLY